MIPSRMRRDKYKYSMISVYREDDSDIYREYFRYMDFLNMYCAMKDDVIIIHPDVTPTAFEETILQGNKERLCSVQLTLHFDTEYGRIIFEQLVKGDSVMLNLN